jgi:hypothetical protein
MALFSQRLHALLRQDDTPISELRFVLLANGAAAVGLGVAAVLATHLSIGWLALIIPIAFALLTLCLLSALTFWIPAALVAAVMGALAAGPLWYLAYTYALSLQWVAAGLGFLVGFGLAFVNYSKVARRCRAPLPR